MQTCSKCNAISPDLALVCSNCGLDLRDHSATAMALKRFQTNASVKAVRITVSYDACPFCFGALRTYAKDEVPRLPHEGCSHELGCRCFYEPVLDEAAIVGHVAQ